MNEQVFFLNMFPDYEPPEVLREALSQAAIVAADIDPELRGVEVAVHAECYIPQRLLDQTAKEIRELYGLNSLFLTASHPATELHKIEPEELMQLFVSRDSMARGSLAGARWEWQEENLTVKLLANGKHALEELVPQVQTVLRERFAAPVTITIEAGKTLEGQALFDAMESMRGSLMAELPAVSPVEKKVPPKQETQSETFYGKPFKGAAVPMDQLDMNMRTIIVEGRVFNIDHKELKKRNAWVVKFDMTDETNSIRISRFMEASEAKPIIENVKLGLVFIC